MFGVFVCYRHTERDLAGRCNKVLARILGPTNVVPEINSERVRAVIVVIARGDWARHLWEPTDVVRLELAESLAKQKLIVPLLIDGATMPKHSELPAELADIVYLNAAELRTDQHFDERLKRIIAEVASVIAQQALSKRATPLRNPDGTISML